MKFIYTNDKYEELGVLKNSSIDFEIGKYDVASNDYQMSISIGSWNREFDKGSLFYCQECEFGGILDGKKVDTSKTQLHLKARHLEDFLKKNMFSPLMDKPIMLQMEKLIRSLIILFKENLMIYLL